MNTRVLFLPIILNLIILVNCKEEDILSRIEQNLPKITLERFSLTETQSGKKKWTLCATTARVYDEIINVDTVKVKFYNDEEREYARLTSCKGSLNTKNHNIFVRDSVVLYTEDSTKLFTDSLFWQNDSQKILTDSYVKIIKKDSTVIEGNGLKTTPDLKRIELIGNIKGKSPIQFPKIR